MWNVNPDRDKSRGGFQDRDLGKTQFNRDYGPDYGVDYARFSDPPDIQKDLLLKSVVEEQLVGNNFYGDIRVTVRNGFVVLKGDLSSAEERTTLTDLVRAVPGVVEVINQIRLIV